MPKYTYEYSFKEAVNIVLLYKMNNLSNNTISIRFNDVCGEPHDLVLCSRVLHTIILYCLFQV